MWLSAYQGRHKGCRHSDIQLFQGLQQRPKDFLNWLWGWWSPSITDSNKPFLGMQPEEEGPSHEGPRCGGPSHAERRHSLLHLFGMLVPSPTFTSWPSHFTASPAHILPPSVANSFSPLWSPFQWSFMVTFPKTQSHFLLLKCLSPFGFGLSILLICLFLLCSLPFSFALLLPNLKIPSASGSILRLLLFSLIHTISAESSCTLFNSRPDSLLQMPSQPHHRLNMYLQAKLPWDTDPFIAPLHAQYLHLDVSHPLKFNIFETELLIFP